MKQFQFEVKNHNNLRKELARVKRFAKNEYYSSIFFQIFTNLDNIQDLEKITSIIDQEFPDGFYYGCQTYGNIIDGHLSDSNTMIVCNVFEYDTSRSKFIYIDPLDMNCEYHSLQDLWNYCNENDWVKGIELIPSYKGAELLGVGRKIGDLREDINVFGGISINPNNVNDEDTYIFAKNHKPSNTGAMAVLVGGPDFHINTGRIGGWEGLGKSFDITDFSGKRIRKIDNEPAMNIYRKYLDVEQDDDFFINAVKFPLLVECNGVEYIRIPAPCENPDEINLTVDVDKDMTVRLSYGEKNTILKHVKSELKSIAEFAPDTVRIYSCAARRVFWGDSDISRETNLFDDVAPTNGFYTKGEILREGNYLNYFNSTIVYSLVREGEVYSNDFDIDSQTEEESSKTEIGHQLLNYIAAVTDELEGQYNSTMKGIANIYKTMFLIDMEDKELIQLDNDSIVEKYLGEKEDYSDKMRNYLQNIIVDQYMYDAVKFCNFHTLPARLRHKNYVSCELISKTYGWFNAQFIVINRDNNGVPNKFVYTSQVIDTEKKAMMEQENIIKTLADTYFTLHVFDLKKDTLMEVSSQDLIHRLQVLNEQSGAQNTIFEVVKNTTSPEYVDRMLEFVDFSTLAERMQDRKMISVEFHGYAGWAKASFIAYEKDDSGELKKVIYTTQIIDEEKKKEQKLLQTSLTDELTKLLNRRAYEIDIAKAEEGEITEGNYVFCEIDINGLKTANDTIGHEAGDELIVATADILKTCFGVYGKVYRVGGDEFFAFLFVDKDKMQDILEDLDSTVIGWKGKYNENLSISIGFVSSSEFDKGSVNEMIQLADKRMYESKEAHYRNKGIDRRGQREAYDMICDSYIKILKVNLSDDSYHMIKTLDSEMTKTRGFEDRSISKWLQSFAFSGQVHKDDIDNYISKTSLDYLREFFTDENTDRNYVIRYRRLVGDDFKEVVMEMVPTKNMTKDNLEVFLYVKNISFV